MQPRAGGERGACVPKEGGPGSVQHGPPWRSPMAVGARRGLRRCFLLSIRLKGRWHGDCDIAALSRVSTPAPRPPFATGEIPSRREVGRPMKLSLEVLTPGKGEGKIIPITLSQFLIGRDPQCHL